uniref:Pectate lyase n=1 Tax=viral metagenome TaxID=1070528 RepID=A0A6M3L9V7_9ZZZZ
MSNWNQNAGFGRSITDFVRTVVPTFGNILVVMNSSDSDEANYQHVQEVFTPNPDGLVTFYTSIESAYAAAESNNNDVILLDANSVHTLVTQIAWSKSRIHMIGMDGGGRITEQGARVQGTVGAAVASLIKVTGTRNSFRNIKFVQNDTNAAALNVVISAGSSTLWQNCSFIFEVTNNLDETTCCEVLIAEAGGTFDNCVFGNDCITSSAARYVTELNTVTGSATSDSPKHNIFRNCIWRIQSSSADAIFCQITKGKFTNTWINPVFHAAICASTSAVILTKAMSVTAGGVGDGSFLVVNPACNTTDLCTSSTNLKVVGSSMNGGADTAYVGIGITPA